MVVWDLNQVHRKEDSDSLIEDLKKRVRDFKSLRDKLSNDITSKEFMEIIIKDEEMAEISSRLNAFAGLWQTENTADSERNSYEAKISQVLTELGNELIFFNIWFRELDEAKANELIKESGKYSYMLERIRKFKPHALSEKEEQIVNLKDLTGEEAAIRFYEIITNQFKFEFDGKLMSQEEVNQFKQSPDRDKRIKSYEVVFKKYEENQDILGEIYKTLVNDWINENVKIRDFKSPINVRNFSNDIPDKAIDALLNVVKKNIGVFQEYFKLKAKICGFNKMDRYDLYAPHKESEKKYPYEECKEITLKTYREFDENAYTMVKRIFDESHVHSEIIDNKRSGAFCYSVSPNLAPYIMLNHVGSLKDLFTMMHEFGHGMHCISANQQTQFTFHSAIPMAETASNFGEMLLSQKLLKESQDKEEKIAILLKMLDSEYASIARQAYFVMFEKEAHDKIPKGATLQELNKIYMDNLKEQFGDMEIADSFQHEWIYIPHIFHTPFYCYSYAFGNLLVLALFKMFEKEGKDFIPKYMKILSYGGSAPPAKILEEADIDISQESFWQQGFDIIKEQLEELKRLMD